MDKKHLLIIYTGEGRNFNAALKWNNSALHAVNNFNIENKLIHFTADIAISTWEDSIIEYGDIDKKLWDHGEIFINPVKNIYPDINYQQWYMSFCQADAITHYTYNLSKYHNVIMTRNDLVFGIFDHNEAKEFTHEINKTNLNNTFILYSLHKNAYRDLWQCDDVFLAMNTAVYNHLKNNIKNITVKMHQDFYDSKKYTSNHIKFLKILESVAAIDNFCSLASGSLNLPPLYTLLRTAALDKELEYNHNNFLFINAVKNQHEQHWTKIQKSLGQQNL